MKKVGQIIILFIFCLSFGINAQTSFKRINAVNFSVIIQQPEDCKNLELQDCQQFKLYQNGKEILSHTLSFMDGDSNSELIELGDFKISSDKLYLYSYWGFWTRSNTLAYKFGFRKQVFQISKKGKVHLIDSRIYIHDLFRSEPQNKAYFEDNIHQGGLCLSSKPNTAFEKEAFKDYVNMIEKDYNAKFVLGSQKKNLEKEVRSVLSKKIHAKTNEWDPNNREIYGNVYK